MASDSSEPLEPGPDAIKTRDEQIYDPRGSDKPLSKIGGAWLRRLRRGGGRRQSSGPSRIRDERSRF